MDTTTFIVPRGCAKAPAYLCTPLDDAMASRSPVLASLMSFEGITELPPEIVMSDLQTWAELRQEEAPEMSTEQLYHALKVFFNQ